MIIYNLDSFAMMADTTGDHHIESIWIGLQPTQSAFTCSKLTIETVEQDVKYVQSLQESHQNDTNGVVL